MAGTPTTAASALYKNRKPERDAAVVERLRRAGAVSPRQAQHAGVRLRRHERTQPFRSDPQSLAPRMHRGRLLRGIGGGGGRRAVLRVARYRHGGLDPPAGGVLRRGRTQGDARTREYPRRDTARPLARSRGSLGAHRARLRAAPRGDRRIRLRRCHERGPADGSRAGSHRSRPHAHRDSARVFLRAARQRSRCRPRARARALDFARRTDLRGGSSESAPIEPYSGPRPLPITPRTLPRRPSSICPRPARSSSSARASTRRPTSPLGAISPRYAAASRACSPRSTC